MDGLTAGRIVHYVLANGEHRPAIVVRVWPGSSNGGCQLQVFTDASNDGLNNVEWRTSVAYSEAPNTPPYTWHWPERA